MEIRWLRPKGPKDVEKEINLRLAAGYRMVYPSSGEVDEDEIDEYYNILGNSLAIEFPCVILKSRDGNILIIEL
jgi:hypothetical protein